MSYSRAPVIHVPNDEDAALVSDPVAVVCKPRVKAGTKHPRDGDLTHVPPRLGEGASASCPFAIPEPATVEKESC